MQLFYACLVLDESFSNDSNASSYIPVFILCWMRVDSEINRKSPVFCFGSKAWANAWDFMAEKLGGLCIVIIWMNLLQIWVFSLIGFCSNFHVDVESFPFLLFNSQWYRGKLGHLKNHSSWRTIGFTLRQPLPLSRVMKKLKSKFKRC